MPWLDEEEIDELLEEDENKEPLNQQEPDVSYFNVSDKHLI